MRWRPMSRHKDQQWNLPEGTPNESGTKTHSWESIHAAVLMDIRDELQKLNRLAGCFRVARALDDLNCLGKWARRRKPKRKTRK